MKIKWLQQALANLDNEAKYIAVDDPRAARSIVARIQTALNQLAENQSLGRPGRVAGTRELVVANTRYVIPYRVRGNRVEILRVFHTSRQLPDNWQI